mmetsp:Transcript_12819/g.37691  ORF Transcript_12819/g.37691 Transcript_12819/m.37691 type:complete len:197 (+) Transcript_12819:671-1261(+)
MDRTMSGGGLRLQADKRTRLIIGECCVSHFFGCNESMVVGLELEMQGDTGALFLEMILRTDSHSSALTSISNLSSLMSVETEEVKHLGGNVSFPSNDVYEFKTLQALLLLCTVRIVRLAFFLEFFSCFLFLLVHVTSLNFVEDEFKVSSVPQELPDVSKALYDRRDAPILPTNAHWFERSYEGLPLYSCPFTLEYQ